ncbi:hypothetical protein KRR26_34190 [Corallococcus sp. M34]|uniref:hypothetical protein n=1 Tax=Citreicoccus inhibens TaxID=2849499 RepID=UPI0018F64B3A|nr:hypothetical protein [Citreicoccus inhibens]MBU8900671.1 hypothetical protein [Citreicoccus inhibens]
MHQPKKRVMPPEPRPAEPSGRAVRPVGMQEMGPGLYEQIRRALTELSPASSNP